MQQWLDLVPAAGGLLNLAAALTNLTTAIITDGNTRCAQPTSKTRN
jgi:hypothetical protein